MAMLVTVTMVMLVTVTVPMLVTVTVLVILLVVWTMAQIKDLTEKLQRVESENAALQAQVSVCGLPCNVVCVLCLKRFNAVI